MPQGGGIEIGGVEITRLNVMQLREQIGVVAQEPVLFATSIYENIRWGREGCTMEEVREAARKANALNFIEEMPDVSFLGQYILFILFQ